MGYSHSCWYYPERLTDTQKQEVFESVKKEMLMFVEQSEDGSYYMKDVCDFEHFEIGCDDAGNFIDFNGTEKDDLWHENFLFYFDEGGLNYTKTDRKPYDMMVMLTLLSLKRNFDKYGIYTNTDIGLTPDEKIEFCNNIKKNGKFSLRIYPFTFKSDGSASEEWLEAIRLYEETTGEGVDTRCIGELEVEENVF
jgi:hypothetical protein